MVWHRGGDNNQTQFLAALFSYQLLLRYILRYNRRVKKDLASGTDVVYLWDGWWMLEEQELDGETWEARRQYVYGGLYIVEPVVSNLQFTEGPAWMAEGSFLLFSDIPASIIYRWSRQDGLKVWRQKSNNANGNTVDLEGRLVTCEHGSRTVTRTGKDGRVETMAATYKGKRLNSPNDVVVKRDGTIWFTDPPYGIRPE
ncbi:MAG: SMP-30/gluconolactonase/LRE family protein, partial [Phycisphaerae bacterium]